MTIQEALVGKTLTGFELAKDNGSIIFQCADGTTVELIACGDCCSQTWIEGIDLPSALKGLVTNVENIPMLDKGNVPTEKHSTVDQVSYYGLKITTTNGQCVLDYRNDSNGYYGGSLEISRCLNN